MAIPTAPTVTSIVTQALKRATLRVPTTAMITDATDHALQEVKADLMLKAPTHPNLLTTATTVTTRGQQRYTVPSDYNVQQSITLLDGTDTYRGTAQGGSSTGIILAAGFTGTDDELTGKYIIITSGPGVEEYREILSYNDSTKTAMVDIPWLSTPTSLSTYLICSTYTQLWPTGQETSFDKTDIVAILGTPQEAILSG